jgi:hypothetical protein
MHHPMASRSRCRNASQWRSQTGGPGTCAIRTLVLPQGRTRRQRDVNGAVWVATAPHAAHVAVVVTTRMFPRPTSCQCATAVGPSPAPPYRLLRRAKNRSDDITLGGIPPTSRAGGRSRNTVRRIERRGVAAGSCPGVTLGLRHASRRQHQGRITASRVPWGPMAVESPSERAVRTESDTVKTTPVHVAQTATVVVPTKTATGTVRNSVMLTAASADADAGPEVGEPSEQARDRWPLFKFWAHGAEVGGEPGNERPADQNGQGERVDSARVGLGACGARARLWRLSRRRGRCHTSGLTGNAG